MTTKEAEAILELAARYFRNQWTPGANSEESRKTILEAARVLLDGVESERRAERKTTMTDDWREERIEAGADWLDERDLKRLSSFDIAEGVIGAANSVVPVVPLDRAEKAEAAVKHPGETGERYPSKP